VQSGEGTVSSATQLAPALAGSWFSDEPNQLVADAAAGTMATAVAAAASPAARRRKRRLVDLVSIWFLLGRLVCAIKVGLGRTLEKEP
jgi:hypothetical protein